MGPLTAIKFHAAALAFLAGQCGATVNQPAVRLGPQYAVVSEIEIGTVTMPWHDLTEGDAQAAIDACIGAVMFWQFYDVRIFAAHNRSCPPERSFAQSLDVFRITLDGVSYRLLDRAVLPVGMTLDWYPFDVYTTDAVGLQTSIDDQSVALSWFIRDT